MKIGITYDLRSEYLAEGYSEEETAEFDREETIEAIAEALCTEGHQVERIGRIHHLVRKLASGQRWDLVFNIAEGLYGLAREAQVPALLDAYQIPYTFADPAVLVLSLDKALCKLVVAEAGLPTPPHAVVRSENDIDRVNLPFPLFVKPLAEGTGKGISSHSKVDTPLALKSVCLSLLERFRQPVLVEQYLPGREFTVGILGTGEAARVLGTMEIILRPQAELYAYSYVNKERWEELVEYRFPLAENDPEVAEAERVALAAWRAIGGRDAGRVDLRSDETGRPHFLEVNPLAGLHPQHSDLPMIATAAGLSFRELIRNIVASATERLGSVNRSVNHCSVGP
ncbi:MAG: D-alanine--D-alanine ligase family protein [Thermogutta sp.]